MKKRLSLSLFSSLGLFYGIPTIKPAFAAKDWGGCVTNDVPSLRCIPIVFENIISASLMFVGAVTAILIVYAGILFVTSGGDQKKVQSARQVITYALIGLVIVLSSFAIIYFIGYTTGATCITKLGFDNCK